MQAETNRIPTTSLYGSAIALVSGTYSLYLSATGLEMGTATWLMVLVGVVVIVHGAVLLTPSAVRLNDASGPLMIGYAGVMLATQFWMEMRPVDGMGGMMMTEASRMGADAGMVALALLMAVSGVVMTSRRGM